MSRIVNGSSFFGVLLNRKVWLLAMMVVNRHQVHQHYLVLVVRRKKYEVQSSDIKIKF